MPLEPELLDGGLGFGLKKTLVERYLRATKFI